MADEAWSFSLTTTELAAGNVSSDASGKNVDVALANTGAVAASTDIALYFLRSKYASTTADVDGRNKLLRHIEKIKTRIQEGAWPPVASSL